MDETLQEKRIRQLFLISISLKGAFSALQIVGGILLLITAPSVITQLIVWLTQGELTQDPNDFIANYLLSFGAQLSLGSTIFGGLYLLSHGLIKIVLVVGLLRNKLWAYPWSIAVLGLFILYQMYRFTFTHSAFLIILTLFDVVVIWLIWREYRIVKKHLTKV